MKCIEENLTWWIQNIIDKINAFTSQIIKVILLTRKKKERKISGYFGYILNLRVPTKILNRVKEVKCYFS